MADEQKRRPGRPRIYPEGEHRPHKSGFASTKAGGWASQKKYRETHKGLVYARTFRMPASNKPYFEQLVKQTGMSISALCLDAIREKYGIDFSVPIEPQDENQK